MLGQTEPERMRGCLYKGELSPSTLHRTHATYSQHYRALEDMICPSPFAVFEAHALVAPLPYKVECLATTGGLVIIGTTDAKIVLYDVEGGDKEWNAQLVHVHTYSSRSAVRALLPIPEKEMLLVLHGDALDVLRLPRWMNRHQVTTAAESPLLTEVSSLTHMKDALGLYARKQKGQFTIAVLHRRRLQLYEFNAAADRLVALKDGPTVADGTRSVAWAGRHLIIASRGEYLLHHTTSATTELLCTAPKSAAFVLPTSPVPELLLAINDTTVQRVLPDGTAVPGEANFQWPGAPQAALYHHPYLVSVHDASGIEVRMPLLTTLPEEQKVIDTVLCQSLPIAVSKMSATGYTDYDTPMPTSDAPASLLRTSSIIAIVDVENNLHALSMNSVDQQALGYAASGHVGVGNLLCHLCPNEASEAVHKKVQLLTAVADFQSGRYRLAMQHLRESDADPRCAMLFLPELLSPAMRASIERKVNLPTTSAVSLLPQGGTGLKDAVAALIDHLCPIRSRQMPFTPSSPAEGQPPHLPLEVRRCLDTVLVKAYALLDREEEAIHLVGGTHDCVLEDVESFLMHHGKTVVLVALWKPLGLDERALAHLQSMCIHGGGEGDRTGQQPHPSCVPQPMPPDVFAALQSLAPHLCMMRDEEGPLSGTILQLMGRAGEAAQCPEDVAPCVIAAVTIVAYMRSFSSLVPAGPAFLQTHRRWLLRNVPTALSLLLLPTSSNRTEYLAGLTFVQSSEEMPGVVPTSVLMVEYLKYLVSNDRGQPPCEDGDLCDAYWRNLALLVFNDTTGDSVSVEARRAALDAHLLNSSKINVVSARDFFESDALRQVAFVERAITYRRLKLHERAVAMFLDEADSITDAQLYAQTVQQEDDDAAAYDILLKRLLQPTSGSPRVTEAMRILRNSDGIDALSVLPMLSDDTPLRCISDFLLSALQSSVSAHRSNEITASVHHARASRLRCTVEQEQSRFVVLDHPQCVICCKTIRPDVAFVLASDSTVSHHGCVEEWHR